MLHTLWTPVWRSGRRSQVAAAIPAFDGFGLDEFPQKGISFFHLWQMASRLRFFASQMGFGFAVSVAVEASISAKNSSRNLLLALQASRT